MLRVIAIKLLVFVKECVSFLLQCTKKLADRHDKLMTILRLVNVRTLQKSLSETSVSAVSQTAFGEKVLNQTVFCKYVLVYFNPSVF